MLKDLYESGDAEPAVTVFVILVVSIVLVALATLAFVRARRRRLVAAEEEASLTDPKLVLREGEVVLSGVVEHAPGHDVAVRVEITQDGTETESSGSWSHRWTEVDRRVIVAPFLLRRPDGTHVRVEPPKNVEVADDLDGKILISISTRIRSAELIPGETLYAHGSLERGDALPDTSAGYRDVAWGWVLRPAQKRMMLSSHPLGDGLRQRAAFHRRYGVAAIACLLTFQFTLIGYYTRVLGHIEVATIVGCESSTYQDSDDHTQYRYDLTIKWQGRMEQVRISGTDCARVDPGQTIAIRRGTKNSWSLGGEATISYFHALTCLGAVFILPIAYGRRRVSTRPWFRRRVVDTGSGPLSSST